MTRSMIIEDLKKELASVPDLELIQSSSEIVRFSRDFYEYSPVLTKKLKDCFADFVVRPFSIEAVSFVAAACSKHGIPLTLRGAGTGNYGQCVPLKSGVVMLMGALKKIRHFDSDTGVVTVESGCLMRDLDSFLVSQGRQLRLMPSTWRSASIGGFISGGSGGIGSVKWGFLRDPGHLLGLEVVTVENPSRKLNLDASDSEALNHAYGTNGIITSLELSTTHAVEWQEVVIDCQGWQEAVQLLQQCSIAAIDLHLCSLLENKLVQSIPNCAGETSNSHRLLILVAPDGVSTIERLCDSYNSRFKHLGGENLKKGTGLRELVWNHTTLHMRALDPSWTYLQMLLPQPEIKAMEIIKAKWGDNLFWHLECVAQQGNQRVAALPVVRWQGQDLLEELMRDCREAGAIIFNPHALTVEDGGLGVIDSDQIQAKTKYDPQGILNPGKLKGWSEKDPH